MLDGFLSARNERLIVCESHFMSSCLQRNLLPFEKSHGCGGSSEVFLLAFGQSPKVPVVHPYRITLAPFRSNPDGLRWFSTEGVRHSDVGVGRGLTVLEAKPEVLSPEESGQTTSWPTLRVVSPRWKPSSDGARAPGTNTKVRL
jgi:hypothetical protein